MGTYKDIGTLAQLQSKQNQHSRKNVNAAEDFLKVDGYPYIYVCVCVHVTAWSHTTLAMFIKEKYVKNQSGKINIQSNDLYN